MPLWGKEDKPADAPKYLSDADKEKVYLVDETEAGVAANKAKGLNTSGWNLYSTYVDANSNTRHRAEVLVALTSATALAAGDQGAILITANSMSNGTEYTIVTVGNTDFTELGAANNDIGTTFTANTANTAALLGGDVQGTVSVSDDSVVADS